MILSHEYGFFYSGNISNMHGRYGAKDAFNPWHPKTYGCCGYRWASCAYCSTNCVSNRTTHAQEAESLSIAPIDLVVANLYPFVECLNKDGASESELVEHIDIGGVSLLRAAAKNFQHVTVISSTQDYDELVSELTENNGSTSLAFRRKMAAKACATTAAYDAHIHGWLATSLDLVPEEIVLHGKKIQDLRIGENPHQKAAVYGIGSTILPIEQLHGKQLSYNNIVDIEASIRIVNDFDVPAVCVIKHGNPCGAAISHVGIEDAYRKAITCDPTSSFGGIIAFNKTMSEGIADALRDIFVEAVVAPDFEPEVLTALSSKKNLRIVKYTSCTESKFVFKSVLQHGLLLQERDNSAVGIEDMRLVTAQSASQENLEDLLFAWRVCKHVRSNAIVIARTGRAIGVGAGQTSRVTSVELAIRKAGDCSTVWFDQAAHKFFSLLHSCPDTKVLCHSSMREVHAANNIRKRCWW